MYRKSLENGVSEHPVPPLTQFSKVFLPDCGCIMDKNRPSDSDIEKGVPLGGGLINAILIGSGKFFLSSFIQLIGYSIFKLYSGRTHIETGGLSSKHYDINISSCRIYY